MKTLEGLILQLKIIDQMNCKPGLGTPGLGTPGLGTPGLGTPGLGTSSLDTPSLVPHGRVLQFPPLSLNFVLQVLATYCLSLVVSTVKTF